MLGDPALGLPLDDKMKSTHVINETESGDTEEEDDDEEEVPEEVDGYISNLLEGLQHKVIFLSLISHINFTATSDTITSSPSLSGHSNSLSISQVSSQTFRKTPKVIYFSDSRCNHSSISSKCF